MTATDYRLIDSTLRDGSHAISHQYYAEDVIKIVAGLDRAGVQVIEIAHGDGLGGSSFNYGFSAVPEKELIAKACETTQNAQIACLMLPGIGLADDLREVNELGVSVARIAVHSTEADITEQHIKDAKDLVDGAPKALLEKATKEAAEDAKAKLEAAGATVTVK